MSTPEPPTVIITRAEAAVLLDWLPVWMLSTESEHMAATERAAMEGLHRHLDKFFAGKRVF